MKCCSCGKEIDVSRCAIPPEWYGMYVRNEIQRVVCAECIKTPEGRAKYLDKGK